MHSCIHMHTQTCMTTFWTKVFSRIQFPRQKHFQGAKHTHTNMHTDFPDKSIFKKPGKLVKGQRTPGLKHMLAVYNRLSGLDGKLIVVSTSATKC